MEWKDYGFIFQPDKTLPWMQSHAQLPVVDKIRESLYRVYFASRDAQKRSHIGYFEIDLKNPTQVLAYTKDPVLIPGEIGHFDEHGVFPSSIINVGNKKFLYYIGWNKGCEEPLFYASIGLAISEDGGKTFQKYSKAPIMSRSEYDPCLVTSPTVFGGGNEPFQMLYVSGLGWERHPQHGLWSHYHIKHATSQDGIYWNREGRVAIDFSEENETNIARASVIAKDGCYKAYFCSCGKGASYRLGCAKSKDGIDWKRKSIQNSDIICYPFAVDAGDWTYLFYNGKGYGAEGIKLASIRGES